MPTKAKQKKKGKKKKAGVHQTDVPVLGHRGIFLATYELPVIQCAPLLPPTLSARQLPLGVDLLAK